MTDIIVNERVQLIQDIPELGLHRGDVGLVQSIWLGPDAAYEVEFQQKKPRFKMRAVLRVSQIVPDLKENGPLMRGVLR